ncbi:OB-fold protein [Flavobacterium sp.]|uniref:OB-fold protein n=1 Tax=Flavobacterium sp. TaxID=239 RepID=UPI002FDE0E70
MRRKVLIFGILFLVIAFLGYRYLYKDHRDIASEKAAYTATVNEIFSCYTQNDSLANATYLDKTVAVKGVVTDVDVNNKIITVDGKLAARFKGDIPNSIQSGDAVVLKGRVTGFNDLLEEIEMDQCSVEE